MAVFGGAIDAAAACLAAQRALVAESWGEAGPLRVRMGVHCGEAEERGGDYFGNDRQPDRADHGGRPRRPGPAVGLGRRARGGAAARRRRASATSASITLRDLGRPEHVFQLVHPDLAVALPAAGHRPERGHRPARSRPPRSSAGGTSSRDHRPPRRGIRPPADAHRTGGTGKTTLAIRVARDLAGGFRDGVSFVDLSGARDTDAAMVAIARAVGLGEVFDRDLEDELTDHLRDRQMLHRARQLRAGHRGRAASSAEPPERLPGAEGPGHQPRGPPRPAPSTSSPSRRSRCRRPAAVTRRRGGRRVRGVQLFVDRARVVRPDFELTDDNAAAVAEICRRLDGLPLAIELAAARLGLFSPDVASRSARRSARASCAAAARDLPERQQTLRSTIDWSYELLEPGEQRLFEQLAVFADARASRRSRPWPRTSGPVDGVGHRRPRRPGRARREEPGPAGGRAGRRASGRDAPDDPRVRRRPARATTGPGGNASAGPTPPTTPSWRDGYGRDLTGSPSARLLFARLAPRSRTCGSRWAYWVEAGDLEQLDKLAKTLLILDDAHGWYLDTIGLATDMLAVLDAVPSSPERINEEIALRTTLARALMATKGFTPEVEAAFASALERFERGVDVGLQYSVLRGLASLYLFRAQLDKSAEIGQQILALGESGGDPAMLIDGHLLVGTSLMSFTDLQAGLDHFDAGHRPVPAAADRDPNRARRQRPARLVPHDVGAHALDARPVRSSGRTRRRRARARGGARAPVHHRLREIPRGPAPALAPRAGAGARARHRTARPRRRARVPDLDGDRQRPPRGGPGRARPAR